MVGVVGRSGDVILNVRGGGVQRGAAVFARLAVAAQYLHIAQDLRHNGEVASPGGDQGPRLGSILAQTQAVANDAAGGFGDGGRSETFEGEVCYSRAGGKGREEHENREAHHDVLVGSVFEGEKRVDDAVGSGEDTIDGLHVRVRSHAPGVDGEVLVGYHLKDAASVYEDGPAVKETVNHCVSITATHGDVEVDLAGLVGKMGRKRLAEGIDISLQRKALGVGEGFESGRRHHLDNVAPSSSGKNNVTELADLRESSARLSMGRRGATNGSNDNRAAKVEVHICAGQGNVDNIVSRERGATAGAAGKETVEDVDEPESTAEALVLQKLVWVGVSLLGGDYPVHLDHTGSLAEVDVGTNSFPATPFVDDEKAEGLDIGKARRSQRLHHKLTRLLGKMLSSASATELSSIASNHGGRVASGCGEEGIDQGPFHRGIFELL